MVYGLQNSIMNQESWVRLGVEYESVDMTASENKQNPQYSGLISVFDDPPKKNVLLLSCMDQRLLDDTVRFMNSLNLQNRYDQVALAGGAMGALQLPDPKLPKVNRWQGVFELHLETAINVLHRPIKDIFLLDHLDCGAYKYLHPLDNTKTDYQNADRDQMIALHKHELSSFANEVRNFIAYQRGLAEKEYNEAYTVCGGSNDKEENKCWDHVSELAWKKVEDWSKIRVSYFVMDLLGKIKQLDVPDGQNDRLPE